MKVDKKFTRTEDETKSEKDVLDSRRDIGDWRGNNPLAAKTLTPMRIGTLRGNGVDDGEERAGQESGWCENDDADINARRG